MGLLWLRQDFIDTALIQVPHDATFDTTSVAELCDFLHSEGSGVVSIAAWTAGCQRHLRMNKEQAKLYFQLCQTVVGEVDVSIPTLMLFMSAQLLSKTHRLLPSPAAGDTWPEARGGPGKGHATGPGAASPRAIAVNSKSFEESAHLTFIKTHLKELLDILTVGTDARGRLTSKQVDSLALFMIGRESLDDSPDEVVSISSLLHLWRRGQTHETVIDVADAIRKILQNTPAEDNPNTIMLDGISRKTVLRSDPGHEDSFVKIMDCHNSYLYVLAPVRDVHIFGCSNTTVIVGAVSRLVVVEHCDNVKLITTCKNIRISNAHHCQTYLCTNRAPLLVGDNRQLVLAPYNSTYPALESHMERAGVDAGVNVWDQPEIVELSSNADPIQGPSHYFVQLPPDHFAPFMVPFKMEGNTKANPCFLAPEYEQAAAAKHMDVLRIRDAVKDANMDLTTKEELQRMIQTQFKEWLVTTGNIRQVQDLMHFDQQLFQSSTPL